MKMCMMNSFVLMRRCRLEEGKETGPRAERIDGVRRVQIMREVNLITGLLVSM